MKSWGRGGGGGRDSYCGGCERGGGRGRGCGRGCGCGHGCGCGCGDVGKNGENDGKNGGFRYIVVQIIEVCLGRAKDFNQDCGSGGVGGLQQRGDKQENVVVRRDLRSVETEDRSVNNSNVCFNNFNKSNSNNNKKKLE